MTKIEKLKNVNNMISKLLETKIINNTNGYLESNQLYEFNNDETHCEIIDIDNHQKTELIEDNYFKRIICIKGKVNIYIPKYNEDILLTSPNTLLITPNTKHSIEAFENSQLIFIYRNQNNQYNKEIVKNNTIYNKI